MIGLSTLINYIIADNNWHIEQLLKLVKMTVCLFIDCKCTLISGILFDEIPSDTISYYYGILDVQTNSMPN